METFDRILAPLSAFIALGGLIYMARAMVTDINKTRHDWLRWLILPTLVLWWFSATAGYRVAFYN